VLKINPEEYARKPAWTEDDIMLMVFPDSYEPYKEKEDNWVRGFLSGETDSKEDLLKDCIETPFRDTLRKHTGSGYLKSSNKEYNPDDFMEWWYQWKVETIVGHKPTLLYKVFDIRRSFKTINKAIDGKNQDPLSEEKKEEKRRRPPSQKKQLVIDEALKIRDKKGITLAPKIVRMSRITKILAPGALQTGQESLSDTEYEKRFGSKIGTVEDWIREGFKGNPLT